MDMVVKLMAITKPPEQRPLSEFRDMLDIADSMRGPGGDDGTLAVVTKGIDAVREIAARAPANAAIPRNPVTPVPAKIPEGTMPKIELRPWLLEIAPHVPMLRGMVGTIQPGTVADLIEQRLTGAAWADLVADVASGLAVGAEITAASCHGFAVGAAVQLQLPETAVPWLAEVAKEVLEIANDSVDDSPDGTPDISPKVTG